jgi:Recombinase-like helix-turn-helix domain
MSNVPYPYLEPRQSRTGAPTDWEQELANVIEAIFAKRSWELDQVVAGLNRSRIRPPTGGEWTKENFQTVMKELGV